MKRDALNCGSIVCYYNLNKRTKWANWAIDHNAKLFFIVALIALATRFENEQMRI